MHLNSPKPIYVFFCIVFGLSNALYAQDSDNDSVVDSIDIDDDNDGILDVDESNGCTGALNYEFYDLSPSGNTTDNIPTTGALATGVISDFDVDALQAAVDPGDSNNFSIRYTGTIFISVAGTYTFFTTSDDGSKLFINGTEVVDNDGAHGSRERSGMIALPTGNHTIEVLFFEVGGGENLSVAYERGAIPKVNLPFALLGLGGTCDFDADGLNNELDLDADNDGIPDNVEAQPTATYIPPSGMDMDGNGLDDAYESAPGAGEGILLHNTLLNTSLDFVNLDTDADGISDTLEAGLALATTDNDGDGLDSSTDTTDTPLPGGLPNYDDPNGSIDTPTTLPNTQNASTLEVDYRDPTLDTDADGVPNGIDIDDDNDGVSDFYEIGACAGTIFYEFYDSSPPANTVDNIPTSGALATGEFASFDVDALQGLVDPGDTNTFSVRYTGFLLLDTADTYTFFTASDDGSKLFINGVEVVSNDGLHAVRERSGTISLATGVHIIEVLFFERSGGESLTVNYQSSSIPKTPLPFNILAPSTPCDTDMDGITNELDADSDADNCNDANEAYGSLAADGDGDGIFGNGTPMVNPDGSVVGASYAEPLDADTNLVFDFLEAGTGAPTISVQPMDMVTCLGCSTIFSVAATADTYQWQVFNGMTWVNLMEAAPYSGTTTANLNVTRPNGSLNLAQYRAIISNTGVFCTVLSDTATLTLRVNSVISNRRITYRVRRE